MQGYNYTIKYNPGKNNDWADALSRNPTINYHLRTRNNDD